MDQELPSYGKLAALVILAIMVGLAIGWLTGPLVWAGDHYTWLP